MGKPGAGYQRIELNLSHALRDDKHFFAKHYRFIYQSCYPRANTQAAFF